VEPAWETRRARAADWETYRRLRLRALADAPGAFASTLDAELALPAEVWRQRAEGGPGSATFIARQDGVDVGLAGVFTEPDPPGRVHLVSMWVDPGHRRQGVARALIGRAIGWAAERRASELVLWVADQNPGARRLYERLGFRPTGDRQPLPSNPARTESLLRLSLAAGPLDSPVGGASRVVPGREGTPVDNLLPIGRFARATRLSVKALRHYDELGLLRPAYVDPSSGYRYYRPAQANQAEAIRVLRSVEMPLEEIGAVLAEGEGEPVAKRLRRHQERLEARLAEHRRMLGFLQRLLDKENVMPYEVTVRELPAQPVAATRTTTDLRGIATAISEGVHTILGELGRRGIEPDGPLQVVYHATEVLDEDTAAPVEICLPVAAPFPGSGAVYGTELAGGPAAVTVHRGPYAEIGPAYHTVSGWISDHGHELAGGPREVYLNDPREVAEADLLTEVRWPIR
jgi:DNA-binding transcriptional MerR regulator/GNAT superfamily N-acetyltransferase